MAANEVARDDPTGANPAYGGDLAAIDLSRPESFVDFDVHRLWDRFRREDPRSWRPGRAGRPGFWALSRYHDVVEVYRSAAFSSEGGTVLATLLTGGDSAAGQMLAVTDGVRHQQLKAVLQRTFSPRVVAGIAERLAARTDALVADLVGLGEVDFAAEVSDRLPMGTIGDLLQLPSRDWPQLLAWNKRALSSDSADVDELAELAARNEILLYFADVVQARRRHPGDDVISALIAAEVDDRPLTDDEVIVNCYSLIIGGDESSRVASIGAVLALSQFADQWLRLRQGEVGIETATEESLRWTTPAMHFGRRAVTDLVLAGPPEDQVRIAAGDVVTLWNISANRDADAFVRPHAFDLGREPNRHVSLGHGAHYCVGAALGRLQLGCLLRSLRAQVDRIEVVGPPRRIYSTFLYSYSTLPVVLWPAGTR